VLGRFAFAAMVDICTGVSSALDDRKRDERRQETRHTEPASEKGLYE